MHVEPHHSFEELTELAKLHREEPIWGKIRALVLAKKGETAERIAEVIGCCTRTVQSWVARYNEAGVEALRRKPGQGRKPRFPPEQYDRLRARLDAGPTEDDGVCTLRGPDVRRILQEEYGVELSEASTYELLHRLGYSSLAPRPIHRKADPEAQASFKKAPAAASAGSRGGTRGVGWRSGSPTRRGSGSKGR